MLLCRHRKRYVCCCVDIETTSCAIVSLYQLFCSFQNVSAKNMSKVNTCAAKGNYSRSPFRMESVVALRCSTHRRKAAKIWKCLRVTQPNTLPLEL